MCQCVGAGLDAQTVFTMAGGLNRGPSDAGISTLISDDEGIKPGGGSTPSSISIARCRRAFLSQSSIG